MSFRYISQENKYVQCGLKVSGEKMTSGDMGLDTLSHVKYLLECLSALQILKIKGAIKILALPKYSIFFQLNYFARQEDLLLDLEQEVNIFVTNIFGIFQLPQYKSRPFS